MHQFVTTGRRDTQCLRHRFRVQKQRQLVVSFVDRFTVFFTGDTVFLDGTAFPQGQLTTDALNLDSKMHTEIDRRVDDFIAAV